MPLHTHKTNPKDILFNPIYSLANDKNSLPRHKIPRTSLDPRSAAQLIADELLLDGQAKLNLATFVTTWMEPEASKLLADCANKNMIDKDEYPQTAELESRCVNIISDLWHAPESGTAVGCSTTGSSEAAMLAGLALLFKWRAERAKKNLDTTKPNLVMGINVQVCWEKFCRYFDVEPRYVPMETGKRILTPERLPGYIDERTIGVVAIMGSTQDGAYEPVEAIAEALDDIMLKTGNDVKIHVDGASGGFFAPFVQPEIKWDFRVERVVSINASGHKYGLVYPGVGWVLWRHPENLPDELVFKVNYLGGEMPTFALNFSRPGAQVVGQYYQFIRLGYEGYAAVHQGSSAVAQYLAARIGEIGVFELITNGSDLPVFVFKLKDDITNYTVFDISESLKKYGWQLPAYTFPKNLEDTAVLRIVIRNGFNRDLADLLISHVRTEVQKLDAGTSPGNPQSSFHH
jgi:glutamate decarboxylase